MPRLNYPLKKYTKAVIQLAELKNLTVNVVNKGGSVVRFELFEEGRGVPMAFWVIHHEHKRKKAIISKEDYRKAAQRLSCTLEEFIQKIEKV